MKLKENFHIYAIITVICWSLAYIFTRLALKHFTPLSLGFLRYFTASCALLLVALITKIHAPKRKDIKWFILAGSLGFFWYMITFNNGCATVSASTSSVIISTTPVITALLARILYKEKLRILQYVAVIVEFIGVGILMLMNGFFSINVGLIWLFLASISLSLYNLLQRKLTKVYSALQTSIISIWFGTVLLIVFSPISITEAQTAPPIQVVYILILGIFSSAIAYMTWAQAFAKAKRTSSVSNYMFITPLLTTVLGILIANETPDFATIVGGTLILVGMFIYNFSEKIFIKIKNYPVGLNYQKNRKE